MNSFKKLSYRLEIGLLIHKYPYVIILCIMKTPIRFPDREFRSKYNHKMLGGLKRGLLGLLLSIPLPACSWYYQEADNENTLEERRQEHVEMLAANKEKNPVNEVASNQFKSVLPVLESLSKKLSTDVSPESIDSLRDWIKNHYNTVQLNNFEESIKKLEQTEVNLIEEIFVCILISALFTINGMQSAAQEYPYIKLEQRVLREDLIKALKNLAESNADHIGLSDLKRVMEPYVNSIKVLKSYDSDFTNPIVENFRELFKKLLDMESSVFVRAFIDILGEDGMTAFCLNEEPYLKKLTDENSDRKSKLQLLELIDENLQEAVASAR